jgi:hypothetical protein
LDHDILQSLRGRALVIQVDDPIILPHAAHYIEHAHHHIHCLRIISEEPLSSFELPEALQHVPIALHAPRLGRFRDFVSRLPFLRSLNIRIYLPNEPEENYTSLRIMSSLGIQSAISFGSKNVDWERLSDLMTYSLLGLVPHAPIEPFNYIAEHYESSKRTDFGSVYFNDPLRFLHIDREGRVGLSRDDLEAGRFIPQSLDELDDIENSDENETSLESWRDVFLRADGCASCQGWRVCLGKFDGAGGNDRGCESFFSELMEITEQYQSLQGKKKSVWQP